MSTEISSIENRIPMEEVAESDPFAKKRKLELNEEILQQLKQMLLTHENSVKKIRFAKLSENAYEPTYGSKDAAGADLYSAVDCTVPAKGKLCVSTDIQVAVPYGYYGRVAPRSGLAANNFIDVGAGVVDSDYRGPLKVLLFNFSDEDFQVKKGDRIAQFICERIAHCEFEQVDSLDETKRGEGGFGSTGV